MPGPLVSRYATTFDVADADGSNVLTSPLGAWLLLALSAGAAPRRVREALEVRLGTGTDDARRVVVGMLEAPTRPVAIGLGVWLRPDLVGAPFAAWADGLPGDVAWGPAPEPADLDTWAQRITSGLVDRFPLTGEGPPTVTLATVASTRVRWMVPSRLVDGIVLGGEWSSQVERVVSASSNDGHEVFMARTLEAGDVAVHACHAVGGLQVVSVIAAPEVPPADAQAAAHDIAAMLTGAASNARRQSLFDLELTGGGRDEAGNRDRHAWTIEEDEVQAAGDEVRVEEVVEAILPGWRDDGTHDLLAARAGFDEAVDSFVSLMASPPHDERVEAVQRVVAEFAWGGFWHRVVTSPTRSSEVTSGRSRGVPRRRAWLRFNRPFAVVGVAVDRADARCGPFWHGVPLFSAWIAEPAELPDPAS